MTKREEVTGQHSKSNLH